MATGTLMAQQRNRPAAQRTPAAADLKIRYRNTVSGNSNESVTMIKGARERSENEWGSAGRMVNITQCDLKRTIQLSEQAQKYIVTPIVTGEDRPVTTKSMPGPERRGGVVTYTSTATDTGERKEMFGFSVRHVKTSVDIESSPDACYPVKQRMETDGWYIDLSIGFDCDLGRAQAMSRPAMPGGCQDETRFKRVGNAKTGYAVSETTTMYGPNGAVTFTAQKEVIDLSRDTLDPALFDIPAGYTEAQSAQELYGMPSMGAVTGANVPDTSSAADAKSAGTIRIGVAPINNKTDKTVSTDTLRERLIGEIQSAGLEAVPLNALTQMAADAEARAKQCDFILLTDISALKSPKVGGMFGRISGVSGAGKSDSRVDFKLFAIGENSPRLQSSATGKEEGDEASAGVAIEAEARTVASEAKKRN
jgi:hypothetical protein